MRLVLIAGVALAAVAATPLAAAEGSAEGPAKEAAKSPRAVGCDNLVTLRKLIVDGEEGPTTLGDYAGCREVEAEKVGAVERRTIIGGLPFECRSVPGGPCLWIRP